MSARVGNIITRNYTDFKGVDFLNAANNIDIRRSPDALNVWKSYAETQSNMIETRPGIVEKMDLLYRKTLYNFWIWDKQTIIAHVGDKLLKVVGFPSEVMEITELSTEMSDNNSQMFYFEGILYIIDTKRYLKYDGEILKEVKEDAYVPTTSVGRSPLGGGKILEDVNVLTGKRKNSFLSNGVSKEYFLDATEIDSVDKVYVNDSLTTEYTVDLVLGKVTFATAPKAPALIGNDNVLIEFTKEVERYKTRISKCTITKPFDNRVFFSGNEDYKNALFHCSLNNPAYISDLDYYECGNDDNAIKTIIVGNNVLWAFKEDNQNKDTIYYLTPTNDTSYGRIYPTKQGNVSIGCYVTGINYKDNLLFLSKNGLEGINGNVVYEQSVSHKSSLIDSKLLSMSNYEFAKFGQYKDYLIIAIDNYMFLGDYRQLFKGTNGTEFEWYVWELPINVSMLKTYNEDLYIGDNKGKIYRFEGKNDLETPIVSYWTTPLDDYGYTNHLKKINKRGAILKVKNMQNGKIKIAGRTNKNTTWDLIKEASTSGFTFENIDFGNTSFETGDNSYIVFRFKRKKIINVALKIYSDELNKPFGLSAITLEAFLSGYVKRS